MWKGYRQTHRQTMDNRPLVKLTLVNLTLNNININLWTIKVCLFSWRFFSNQKLITNYRRHHYRWKATNVDLYSTPMAIMQWGFFTLPHRLWHGTSVCNGHLQGPVTLIPFVERITVDLLLPVFTVKVFLGWLGFEHPTLACEANALIRYKKGIYKDTYVCTYS